MGFVETSQLINPQRLTGVLTAASTMHSVTTIYVCHTNDRRTNLTILSLSEYRSQKPHLEILATAP